MDTLDRNLSVSDKVWQLKRATEHDVLYIMQRYRLPRIVAHIIASRNISDVDQFLTPLLKSTLPDPFHLLDMEKAVKRTIDAINNKDKIVVFGDYDVDGATSSALLKRYFAEIGVEVVIYIPDRITEGYGPNADAMYKFKEQGNSLCITVDCGTVANEALLVAQDIGLDVIVIDHHLGGDVLPPACAIINPNRLDEDSEYREIAAVGVTFLFVVALNKLLRESNFFQSNSEPVIYDYLDLVALGTVCDVMPLNGLNRSFVAQGIKVMAQRRNIGIRALSDALKIYEPIGSYHLGFVIGPHINAGGRVGQSYLGSDLLSTQNEEVAKVISAQLMKYNCERRELEKQATDEAIEMAKKSDAKMLVLTSYTWHPGIIGLVASRVKDMFCRPTVVITIEQGVGKASCRSVSEIDIGALVLSAKLQGLLIKGGGHKMAAGFSVEEEKIEHLSDFFNEQIVAVEIRKSITAEGIISLPDINLSLWYRLQKIAPFGTGNPEPKFILQNVFVKNIEIIKNNHIKCLIYTPNSDKFIKAIAFNSVDTHLGRSLMDCGRAKQIMGRIKSNYWQGRVTLNFLVEDIMV